LRLAAGLVILAGVWAAKNIRGMIEKSIRQQLIEQLVEIEQELPTGLEKPAEELKFPVQTGTEREVGELEPLIPKEGRDSRPNGRFKLHRSFFRSGLVKSGGNHCVP